ncbi:MAG: hypothetical protein LUH21_14025 [Clostridiales bacterium]|nr:hypothetical protein [Clostridiales bacterium]
MDSIALFNNLSEYKKDLKFLETVLLISTDSDADSIDKIYDFASRETFPYSIYKYNRVDTDINSFTQEYKEAEDVLKKNCIASALYTLLFLRDSNQYSPLSKSISKYIGRRMMTEEYNHTYDLFDRTVEEGYLKDFALIQVEEIEKIKKEKKVKEKKRLICDFCEEFTLHIIVNHRNNSGTENEENIFENFRNYDMHRFPLDHYLSELKEMYHYKKTENVRRCNSVSKDSYEKDYKDCEEEYRKNILEISERNTQNKVEYEEIPPTIQYRKNKKRKINVWNIFSGLEMVETEWKSNEEDNIKRFLYEYKKQMVFHSNSFLTRFAKIQQKSDQELYFYEDDPYYYIDELTEVLKLPIAFGIEDIYMKIAGILHEGAFSFQYISIPILEKTFFAVLFERYNENIDECIQVVSKYILDHYSKQQEMGKCLDKINNNFIDSDVYKHLAPELIKAFSSQRKFELVSEYKQNNKFLNIRNKMKEVIAMDYFLYIIEYLAEPF